MATKEMVIFCFDTLQGHFDSQTVPQPEFDAEKSFPLFVTWEIEDETYGDLRLRGCIGTLSAIALSHLRHFSLKSALKDSRFPPIELQELPKLHCTVSLLVDFEKAVDYEDYNIAVHGLVIDFTDSNGTQYHGTYLPHVAQEQGWNHLDTITSLAKKAEYYGPIDEDFLSHVQVTRYRSSKAKLSYHEYKSLIKSRDK